MSAPEEYRIIEAQAYFRTINQPKAEIQDTPEYQAHLAVLFEATREKKIIREESLPFLFSNIRNVQDAFLTVAILEEGKKSPSGEVTAPQIRESLKKSMGIQSEEEATEILGDTNTLQMYLSNKTGGFIHRRTAEKKKVYYSIDNDWKSQAEAFTNAVLSYSDTHIPFQIFAPRDKYTKRGETGLPLKLEILQYLYSEFNSQDANSITISYNRIMDQFPENRAYLSDYLFDLMEEYAAVNLLDNHPVRNTESQMSYRLVDTAPETIKVNSPKLQDFYTALLSLQKDATDQTKHFTAVEIAHRMATLFPEEHVSGEKNLVVPGYNFIYDKKSLDTFLSNFGRMIKPIHSANTDLLDINQKVSNVTITTNNDYEASRDFCDLLRNGKDINSHFFTTYRSRTDPESIKNLWIAGKYFNPEIYGEYRRTYLEKIIADFQNEQAILTTSELLQIVEKYTTEKNAILYYLISDGYITKKDDQSYRITELKNKSADEQTGRITESYDQITDTRINRDTEAESPASDKSVEQNSEQEDQTTIASAEQDNITENFPSETKLEEVISVSHGEEFTIREPVIITDTVRQLARVHKYANPYIEEEMREWEKSMTRKEDTGKFYKDEQVLWEFYKNIKESNNDVVLFEDDDLLLLNKPALISSHVDDYHPLGVEELARYAVSPDVTLVNRIDNSTSGIIVLAKTEAGLEGMLAQFLDKTQAGLGKYYLALVDGRFNREEQFVSVPIVPTSDRRMRILQPGERKTSEAKNTATYFRKLVEYYNYEFNNYKTLLEVQLITGRKHQIRAVSAQFLKLPLTGDNLYNPYKKQAPRTLLHAEALTFTHPVTNQRIEVQAELPDDFKSYLDNMQMII